MNRDEYLNILHHTEFSDGRQELVEESFSDDIIFRDISPDFETTSKGGGDTVIPTQYMQSGDMQEQIQEDFVPENMNDIPVSDPSSHLISEAQSGEDPDQYRSSSEHSNSFGGNGGGDGGQIDHLPLINIENNEAESSSLEKDIVTRDRLSTSRKSASLNGIDNQSESEHNYSYVDDFTDIMSDIDDSASKSNELQRRYKHRYQSNKSDISTSSKNIHINNKLSYRSLNKKTSSNHIPKDTVKVEYTTIPKSRTNSTHSSIMNQPVVVKHKTNVKIKTEETFQLTPRGKKSLSVPTQIKAEALWHEGTLRVILRGPPNRLPPLKNIDYKTASSPTLPLDVELTFIPQHNRVPAKPKAPPKPSTTTAIANYRARKPALAFNRAQQHGLPCPTSVKEVDRNIIQNRAIGVGFITKLTPPKEPRIPVHHMISLPRVQHQGPSNNITSQFPYGGGISGRTYHSINKPNSRRPEGI